MQAVTTHLLKLYRLRNSSWLDESEVIVYATSIEEAVRIAIEETRIEAFGSVELVPFERGIVLVRYP